MTTAAKKQSVNTKEMLMCVLLSFHQFGIKYISAKDFISAKDDLPLQSNNLLRLLFDLSLLHMFDYEIELEELGVKTEGEQAEESMRKVVLAHLVEAECPMLMYLEGGKEKGLNFESSRVMLMVIGWVMAVSDYFWHVGEYVVRRSMKKITNKQQNTFNPTNSHNNPATQSSKPPLPSDITSLCKAIRVTLSNLNNLKHKKLNLLSRVSHILKEFPNVSPSQFLYSTQSPATPHLALLAEFIAKEKPYMRFRNHFWAWMENVIKKDKEGIRDHPEYEFEEEREVVLNLEYDGESLQRFLEEMERAEGLMEEYQEMFGGVEEVWEERVGRMAMGEKKEMEKMGKVIQGEIGKMGLGEYEEGWHGQKDRGDGKRGANSFIGLQLKQMFWREEGKMEQEQEGEEYGMDRGKEKEEERWEIYESAMKLCQANMERMDALKFI